MKVLLLAALLGLSGALQAGYEYTYKYQTRIALGIPDISSQVAASALYATVKIQVIHDIELKIQLSDIKIGDMNDRISCEDKMSQDDPYEKINYQPIVQYKDQLEKPFRVLLTGDQLKPLQFPDTDEVWIRNLRRALVHLLHLPTNAPNIRQTPISNSPSFTRIENSPLGECPTWYTVNPLMVHLHRWYPVRLENDAQDDLKKDYWRLSKQVDFENCTDMASSHTIGTMLPGKSDNDKCGEDYVSTATSGHYILRGGPRKVRIEKAVQEGTYIVDDDNVHTYSGQILTLRSVDPMGKPFDVSGSFYSFRHEIDVFSWQTEESSGININWDTSNQEIKIYAKRRFKEMADTSYTGEPDNYAEDMESISTSLGLLAKDQLQDIYDSLSGDARSLFMKALTASGLEIPYLFLMEKLSDASDPIAIANKVDFLINAVQNTKTTKLIEPMMNVVMNGDGPDFLRGLSIVNFATLATRMCTKPCGREYLGEAGCQMNNCRKLVEDTYLPWLEKGLNDESKTLWERMVYMMAIYNFNSEKIIPIVRPYVTGAKDADVRLRVSAIYSLRKENLPQSTGDEIRQIFMAVLDNYQEHYRVREAAFGVMLFWKFKPVCWHYVALMTWRDPNDNMVNLISNTIYTYSKFDKDARRVVALTKPVKPRSLSKSFLAYNKDGTNDDMMRYWYEFFLSGNDEGIFPRMVSAYLRLGLVNANFDALKVVGHFDGSNMLQFFWKTFANLFGKKDWKPDVYMEKVKAMYNEVLAKLEMETKEQAKNIESFLHMTIFNNFQAVIPLMRDIENMEITPEMLMGYLFTDGVPVPINRQFFINSGRISHAYATEVGVPYMIRYTQPKFFSCYAISSMINSGSYTEFNLDMTIRVDRFIQSSSHAVIPWSGKAMVSGVNRRQLLVLPLKFKIAYDSETNEFSFNVEWNHSSEETSSQKEYFGIYNQPFTVRAPIVTPMRLSALKDFKFARKGLATQKTYKDDLIFPGTELNLGAVFVGDVPPLFTRASSTNFYASFFQDTDYKPFPPTNKYFLYKIGADYSKSKVKGFTIEAQYFGKIPAGRDILGIPGADNYEVNTIIATLIFEDKDFGTRYRQYKAGFGWANGWTNRYESKIAMVLGRVAHLEPPTSRCILIHTSSPGILSMTNTRDFIDIYHATKISLQTYYGATGCDQSEPPIMQFDGELTLSEEKKERLGYESPTDCKKTLRNPNNFNILSYDKMTYTRTWRKDGMAKFPLISYLANYFTPGVMFPKAYLWYEQNYTPERAESFEAYKQRDGWNFKLQRRNMNVVGEQIEVPQFIEQFLLSPRPYKVTMYDRYFLGYDRPICYATASQVQTFDELTFKHNLDNCWTVAVRDCKQDSGLVNVRNNGGEFEASILWTVGGLKVDITKDQVKINREDVAPGTISDLYQVHQVTQGRLVQISWVAAVRVTNLGISIEVHPSYKGSLCGACSNYDGDSSTMTGPKGCSYNDYDMFMAAWAMPGDGCDDAALAAKKDQFKAYQASCNKQFIYPTGQVLTSMQKSCFEYNYDVRTEGDYKCTSTEPISTCKPGCTTAIPNPQNVMYDCVASDAAANNKQKVRGLPSYPKPGCHYFKKWWKLQSTGCVA